MFSLILGVFETGLHILDTRKTCKTQHENTKPDDWVTNFDFGSEETSHDENWTHPMVSEDEEDETPSGFFLTSLVSQAS